jgi:hypothetical protein
MAELTALTHVLESLVNDNESLKHDNAELQNLLVESREETHLLQQEVEEHRANSPLQAGSKHWCISAPTSLLTAMKPARPTYKYIQFQAVLRHHCSMNML